MSRWSRWVALLDRREPATALAICRIVAGATVFQQLMSAWAHGVAAAMWVDERYGGVRGLDHPGVLAVIGGATSAHVTLLLWFGLVASALMTVGLFGRVAMVLTWFAFRTVAGLNDESGGSGDDLLVDILFVLMFSGASNALSIDARWRGRVAPIPAWPRYVLVGQLVTMYFSTALQKLSASWLPWGTLDALWYILRQPTWLRFPTDWLAPLYPLTQLATLGTWLFEITSPLLLLAFWYRATRDRPGRVRAWFNRVDFRRAWLLVGLGMHVGIDVLMVVGPFLPGAIALYACCVSPAEWERVGSIGRRRRAVPGAA